MAVVRLLTETDATRISQAFAEQGWHKSVEQYRTYFEESQAGSRTVLIAETENGAFAGYTTIVWQSHYPPFLEANVPEIVDFNVLIKYQRRGIGSALMDAAEALIAQRSNTAGIGFGLMHDYGNAQILYTKRGYIPDGRGIFSHGRWLKDGDKLTLGHDVALYLTKSVA